MTDENASTSSAAAPSGQVVAESAIAVVSCSRLGRTANPPTRSFTDWLRPRRRRYTTVSGS